MRRTGTARSPGTFRTLARCATWSSRSTAFIDDAVFLTDRAAPSRLLSSPLMGVDYDCLDCTAAAT